MLAKECEAAWQAAIDQHDKLPSLPERRLELAMYAIRVSIKDLNEGGLCFSSLAPYPRSRRDREFDMKSLSKKQISILEKIVNSPLVKTITEIGIKFHIDGISILSSDANFLISNNLIIGQKDGIGLFEDSQTYILSETAKKLLRLS